MPYNEDMDVRARDSVPAAQLVALIAVVVLLAAACSSSPTESSGSSTTTGPGTTASVPESIPIGSTTTIAPTSAPPTTTIPVPVFVDENGFDDHTVPGIESTAEYFALARQGVAGQSIVKFNIPNMLIEERVNWMDSNFYSLHDEWYWYRLLNGQPIAAIDVTPLPGHSFATIADVYEWLETDPPDLPAELQVIDSRLRGGTRLYAPNFYTAALHSVPRNYGAGSLVHMTDSADGGGERWLIELEFADDPTPSEVALFFERLSATLPIRIADELEWVLRSPDQEATASAMAAAQLPYHDRVVRYSELVRPGEVAVSNEGIAAGRLLRVDGDGTKLTDATAGDVLLVENVPDWLPPAAALISSSPQTPLAHVNLLAQNRGIPNVSMSGLFDDPGLAQAARVRAHVVVRATEAEGLSIVLITHDEYRAWAGLGSSESISVPSVDLANMPLVLDLTELAAEVDSESEIAELRPVIGGKSAGFLTLLAAPGVTTPPEPQAITVRPYFEHLGQVERQLDAMLADPDFLSSPRARYLLLEGPDDFAVRYTSAADAQFAQSFTAAHPPGSGPIGEILAAGGFMELFRDQPMSIADLDAITESLEQTFGHYAPTQGLRFRSSSSVEDIEGFNGAGLYDSNTGFLLPGRQPDEKDRDKSVERTIKKTWASYWSAEAVEERELENVDHRSGGMAVLVHARFDDALEVDNGVATYTLFADGGAVARINTQHGAVSVTNPDPVSPERPEVIEVLVDRSGTMRILRLAESSLSDRLGGPVMNDSEVRALVAQLESATRLWRTQVDAATPADERGAELTLDFEIKTVAAGWPALESSGRELPGRLVLKQARPLRSGAIDEADPYLLGLLGESGRLDLAVAPAARSTTG